MANNEEMLTDKIKIPQLLTAMDVAEILNIGLSTVYQLVQRQDLPSIHIGRSVRVRTADLDKFIELKVEEENIE